MTRGYGTTVDEERLYCYRDQAIWAYRIDAPTVPPAIVCDSPEKLWIRSLAVGDGFLVAAPMDATRREVWVRPLRIPATGWVRVPAPGFVRTVALHRGQILAAYDGRLGRRPVDRPEAHWEEAGTAPGETCVLLVRDDLLVHIPTQPAAIHARPVTAAPDAPWEVVGRVILSESPLSARSGS
jgi:hypothetical protein